MNLRCWILELLLLWHPSALLTLSEDLISFPLNIHLTVGSLSWLAAKLTLKFMSCPFLQTCSAGEEDSTWTFSSFSAVSSRWVLVRTFSATQVYSAMSSTQTFRISRVTVVPSCLEIPRCGFVHFCARGRSETTFAQRGGGGSIRGNIVQTI